MNQKFLIFNPFRRLFHVSCNNSANIHRAFRKVLNSNTSKKRKLKFQEFDVFSGNNVNEIEEKSKGTPNYKRANVLNKLYMRYITDVVVNGEYYERYNNLGIEITKVQIAPDYKKLNVFWVDKKNGNKVDIQKFLTENAFALRHELSQLNVIGIVPPIGFVEDKHHNEMVKLSKLMEQADYGDDYEPLSVSRLKYQLELYRPIDEDMKIQLEKIEADEKEEIDVGLPNMPQNVLGLDHSNIMKKIVHHKTPQRNFNISESSSRLFKTDENLKDTTLTREEFKSFLLKRQIENQKLKKVDKNYILDKEFMEEEQKQSFQEHYENIEMNLDKFEDYIEDDTDEK